MSIFDVVLHTNVAMFAPDYQKLAATDPPVERRVQAISGLFIERVDLELAKAKSGNGANSTVTIL